MKNLEVVKSIYAAFGRGDVSTILSHLHPEVEWEYGGTPSVPWLEPRRGREGAAQFFVALGGLELQTFVPKSFLEADDLVVVLCEVKATVKATGREFVEEDEVHLWRFNHAGLVIRFRHRADTELQARAYLGGR
jgi:uncharacterized protein